MKSDTNGISKINLYKIILWPVIILVMSFLFVFAIASHFHSIHSAEKLQHDLKQALFDAESSFADEVVLQEYPAIQMRINRIILDVQTRYEGANICISLQPEYAKSNLNKPITQCSDRAGIDDFLQSSNNFVRQIRVSGVNIAKVVYRSSLQVNIYSFFSPEVMFATFVAMFITFVAFYFLIKNIRKNIIMPFQETVEYNAKSVAFSELAGQVAHDIRSPAAAVLMLAKESVGLPEEQRLSLRDAANRIHNIANHLLSQYGGDSNDEIRAGKILIPPSVLSVFTEKKMQHKELPVSFLCNIAESASFAYVNINKTDFERMISNLISNAFEALIFNQGEVEVRLFIEPGVNNVVIQIIDNGRGMSQEFIDEFLNKDKVISQKQNGHGLGLTYTKSVLKESTGVLDVFSQINQGTTIELRFKAEEPPIWIATEINFRSDDIIIILDDDCSVHGAWDRRFQTILATHKNSKILHFNTAEECLVQIQSFSQSDKSRVLLLADYELINQDKNGLDVIELIDINRSFLVTSHYENMEVIKRAILCNAYVLPKILASDVKLILNEENSFDENKDFDLIIVDDAKEFSEVISYLFSSKDKKLRVYHNPYELLSSLLSCDKQIKICFDYDLECPVNGVELAEVLWRKGYNNLYLATGYQTQKMKLPAYLRVLNNTMDLLNL